MAQAGVHIRGGERVMTSVGRVREVRSNCCSRRPIQVLSIGFSPFSRHTLASCTNLREAALALAIVLGSDGATTPIGVLTP